MADTKKIPKVRRDAAPKQVTRLMGWENTLSGLGVSGKDKRLGGEFYADVIDQDTAEQLWRGDDIGARLVETLPDEMLREGFEICIEEVIEKALGKGKPDPKKSKPFGKPGVLGKEGDEEEKEDAFEDPSSNAAGKKDPRKGTEEPEESAALDGKELAEAMDKEHRRINTIEVFRKALHYARAYGGAAVLLGADDGSRDLRLPLQEDKIKSFDWMTVLTPRECQPVEYYSNPRKPKYGEVAVYRIHPINSPPGGEAELARLPEVHESRILRFGGIQTSRRATYSNIVPGWDDSIFVRLAQIVSDFQASWQGAGILLQDFATPVLKIKGLAKVLAAKNASSQSIAVRAGALEMSRSIARVLLLDSEEEFKRETVTVTGLAEILDRLALRLAAAAKMPVSLLMGQSPAGLNATGDSDIRWFYDQVSAMQERAVRAPASRVTKLLFLNKSGPAKGKEPENWDLKFGALWQLTEKEQAEVRKIQAEVDSLYIDAGVVTTMEITKSRFGGDGYSTETTVNMDLRNDLFDDDAQAEELSGPSPDEILTQAKAAAIGNGPPGAPGKPGAKPPPGKGKPPFGKGKP
jgi:uncharacterized protein